MWSAVSGLVVGLLSGVLFLAMLTLAAHVIPGIPDRMVERLRIPVAIVLLVIVPLVSAALGYLEGRAKLS